MPATTTSTPSQKRSVKSAWLAADPDLDPFCRFNPHTPDWQAVIESREAKPINRQVLVDALLRQYKDFPDAGLTRSNISLLAKGNTYTITTGQQPGFLGGPLYTIYKTLTAIRLCEQLRQDFPAYNFVPVFWVASEDHDIAEVDHAYLGYRTKLEAEEAMHGPAGRHILSSELVKSLPDIQILLDAYKPGHTWGEAFRRLLHSLFGHNGLIALEPDDEALKALFAPVIEQELAGSGSEQLVNQTSQELAGLGFSPQIFARPINLFFLSGGKRLRIDKDRDGLFLLPESESASVPDRSEITQALAQKKWAAFSPNVVLRPVYQETILPNLAYIGGWAEVAYWMQLPAVFEQFDTFYPLVLPRASALLVSKQDAEQLAQIKIASGASLTLDQLLGSDVRLRELLVHARWSASELTPAFQAILAEFEKLAESVVSVDTGQQRNVLGEKVKAEKFFHRLEANLIRSLARQHPAWVSPAFELKQRIQPQGYVQERILNWLAFGAKNPIAFIDTLHAQLALSDYSTQVIIV